jgi:hypothetical protein
MRKAANEGKVAPAGAVGANCPYCKHELSDDWIKAAHSRIAGRQGGRPRVLRPCPYCRKKFGARDLREHIPQCDKVPKRAASKSPPDSTAKSANTKRGRADAGKQRTAR